MRLFLKLFLLFSVVNVFSQNTEVAVSTVKIDSLYREDQFYFGFTFNTLQNKPIGLTQNNFSPGFSIGFLRDFPVNKKRTVAIAPGIGFAINSFNQNLAITLNNQKPVYDVVGTSFSKNRISNILIEMPLEFRWRTSTYESYKFWRIYGGVKLGYLLYDKSIFVDSQGKTVIKNNNDFNKIQYGAYISSGYHSINVYLYYGLNPLFKSAKTSTESIDMNALNIGIMFYIL